MRIPAAAVKPLVVLAVSAVSFGCITPAYAQDATATGTSDGSNHIVVDINLHDDTDSSGSDSKSDSSSTDDNDSETTGEAKGKKEDELKRKWWEKACGDIRASSFLIVLGFAVLAAIIGGIIWTKYGGRFNSLSPYEQDEFIHSAWILVLLGGVFACMGTLFVVLNNLTSNSF